MNIQIKPELEQIIQAQIATGRYTNPEEVISKALKLLLEWENGYQQWIEETREKVEVAIEQLDKGEGIDGEVVVEQLREKLSKLVFYPQGYFVVDINRPELKFRGS